MTLDIVSQVLKSLSIASLFTLGLFQTCKGDDSAPLFPNTDLYVPQFNVTVTMRQNFCELQSKFHAGEIDLLTAFEGQKLNVAIGDEPNYVNFSDESRTSINSEDLGIAVKIFDEISKRGKFTWKDSFALEGSPPSGTTYTELLDWSVNTYDVSVNYWTDTAERNSMGISFPHGWYDASLIIVGTKDDDSLLTTSVFDPISWMAPFTGYVWLAIVATLVFTAIIGLIVEGRAAKRTIYAPFKNSIISAFFSYVHQAFLTFTGHLEILPRTHAGQIVSFSMSFFAMLLLASYTANLASFLVIEKTNLALQVNTVNDIVQLGKSMCVWGTTAAETVIRDTFPTVILADDFKSDKEVLQGVKEGQCNYAIVSLASYELYKGMEAVNKDCDLVRIGRPFRNTKGGFATQSDAGTFCTSLVRDMLHAHLRIMETEGFIDDAWKDYYKERHDIDDESCSSDNIESSTKETSDTLNITNLGGVFLFHGVLLFVSFGVFFLETSIRKRNGTLDRDTLAFSQNRPRFGYDEELITQRIDEISENVDELSQNVHQISKQVAAIAKMMESSMKESEKFDDNPQLKSLASESKKTTSQYDLSGREDPSMDGVSVASFDESAVFES